jgi:hypothetical protein
MRINIELPDIEVHTRPSMAISCRVGDVGVVWYGDESAHTITIGDTPMSVEEAEILARTILSTTRWAQQYTSLMENV